MRQKRAAFKFPSSQESTHDMNTQARENVDVNSSYEEEKSNSKTNVNMPAEHEQSSPPNLTTTEDGEPAPDLFNEQLPAVVGTGRNSNRQRLRSRNGDNADEDDSLMRTLSSIISMLPIASVNRTTQRQAFDGFSLRDLMPNSLR